MELLREAVVNVVSFVVGGAVILPLMYFLLSRFIRGYDEKLQSLSSGQDTMKRELKDYFRERLVELQTSQQLFERESMEERSRLKSELADFKTEALREFIRRDELERRLLAMETDVRWIRENMFKVVSSVNRRSDE